MAAAGQGFNKARIICRISQRLANLVDGRVDAVIEVDEGILGPEFLVQLFTGHDFSRILQQYGQHLKGLSPELDLQSVFAQFAGAEVDFERTMRATDGVSSLAMVTKPLSWIPQYRSSIR